VAPDHDTGACVPKQTTLSRFALLFWLKLLHKLQIYFWFEMTRKKKELSLLSLQHVNAHCSLPSKRVRKIQPLRRRLVPIQKLSVCPFKLSAAYFQSTSSVFVSHKLANSIFSRLFSA
jgi:hypothetical protein